MHSSRVLASHLRTITTITTITAITAAALAAVSLAGTGIARAAYLGSEGRIAFVRHGDIYSIKPTGTGQRLLAGGGHDSGPRWSPNGSRLAYLDHGDLWIMNADGSHKHQITAGAPRTTDGRPSWSPSGRYLAFVRTARSARHGILTRYDTVSGHFRQFTASFEGGPVAVPAVPGTAVAWNVASDGTSVGYFIMYEGAGVLCSAHHFCLNALGFGHESQFAHGFPSAEEITTAPKRLTDPDWYPLRPQFATDLLTSVGSCTAGHCTHGGIQLKILGRTILPGAYEAVYSPAGSHVAFVRNGRHGPVIYLVVPPSASPVLHPHRLTTGTEPDWQPVAPFPPA